MKLEVRSSVTIDVCPSCKGVWLDAGELARILGTNRDLMQERLYLDDVPQVDCPECRLPMTSNWFSNARQVLVDTCPSCRGVWLDGGELQALLKELYGI